jgi:large subunit ribosomal protein L10
MNRSQKENIVNELKTQFETNSLVALVDYKGITVEEINEVRRSFEKEGLQYFVRKNKLILKAVAGTEREGLNQYLKGMTGIILSGEDAIAAAKVIRETVKGFKGKTFNLKGGFFDGDLLDAKSVEKVADLPSKEELLCILLRTLQEGPRQVLGVIQGPARDLVNLLKNYENQLTDAE